MKPDYRRTRDPSLLHGGEEDWQQVRVFRRGASWVWEDALRPPFELQPNGYCTQEDLLSPSSWPPSADLPELLYYMLAVRFVPTDANNLPVGAFFVMPANGKWSQGRCYYAKPGNRSPYADLAGRRVADLDGDGRPETIDSLPSACAPPAGRSCAPWVATAGWTAPPTAFLLLRVTSTVRTGLATTGRTTTTTASSMRRAILTARPSWSTTLSPGSSTSSRAVQ